MPSTPDAYNILHRNGYGWFVAVERGVLRPDRDRSEGASALAADDFASRFAVPCHRRIEADHCLKINPRVNLAEAVGTTQDRANP